MFDELKSALEAARLTIRKFDKSKKRYLFTSHGTMNAEKFCAIMLPALSMRAAEFPEVWKLLHDPRAVEKILEEFAAEEGILEGLPEVLEIPPDLQNVTLNYNLAAKGKDDRFFLTHPDETVSRVSGESYLLIHRIKPMDAIAQARKVVPDYRPRGPRGVSQVDIDGKIETVFNIYTPPCWLDHPDWDDLPDELPELFTKLICHLFPIATERRYFFAWLHASLFKRAYVFLILCGAPGTGKNRLKLVLRALHGHLNTTDGKKSTLTERFNSQLSESTLAWFDELHYDAEMENTMKELQNDSISIERKGVDATRATKIHASIVISNNKPRDNYIAFDARKFAPLKITANRLETSMTPEEIDQLTQKVEDPGSETFDTRFIAQIAKWIMNKGQSNKWPHLEYRGPMFWTLAHTSMTRWQKRVVMVVTDPENYNSKFGYDAEKKSFLWSVVQTKLQKKNGDRSLQFPDFTTVQAFFEVFRDGAGRKAFRTEVVPGNNLLGDFWVQPTFQNPQIITESTVLEQRRKQDAKRKEETLDL